MSKFKLADKVRVLDGSGSANETGDIGIITEIQDDDLYRVTVEGRNQSGNLVIESNLELVNRLTLPKEQFLLLNQEPVVVNLTIMHLRLLGVPIGKNTTSYDRDFPFVFWNGSKICLRAASEGVAGYGRAERFIEQFAFTKPTTKTIALNKKKEYDCVVHKDKVVVGCQTIDKEKVEEILSIMKELA